MFVQRTAVTAARRALVAPVVRRGFSASVLRRTKPSSGGAVGAN